MGQMDTKGRILNAAERLFARDGYRFTSLRAITKEAKVNLAAVNYHFGSKEALLKAVFERRLIPLNKTRRENLERVRDDARKKGCKPKVRDVMHAFIEPTLRLRESGPEAKDFIALVGRALHQPDETVKNAFFELIWPLFMLLYETLSQALPNLSRKDFFWRVMFSMGAMDLSMHISQIKYHEAEDLIKIVDETDTDSLLELILSYVTEGLEAS